jgi:hypothetical protein
MSAMFSQKLRISRLGPVPQVHEVVADAQSRAALAAAFGLPDIARLNGVFSLTQRRDGIIDAELRMDARLTQTCVLTLEPFEATIAEAARLRFVPDSALAAPITLDPQTLDGPDEIPYTGESIDLGAALAEQLALSLDPYPRKPGAVLPA